MKSKHEVITGQQDWGSERKTRCKMKENKNKWSPNGQIELKRTNWNLLGHWSLHVSLTALTLNDTDDLWAKLKFFAVSPWPRTQTAKGENPVGSTSRSPSNCMSHHHVVGPSPSCRA